ncbi:MAG TPA: hypothetical protein PKB15_03635 [Acidimicrobiia bacterium]|nr:hypothetical protein [Acidimicrobiia bacterium]
MKFRIPLVVATALLLLGITAMPASAVVSPSPDSTYSLMRCGTSYVNAKGQNVENRAFETIMRGNQIVIHLYVRPSSVERPNLFPGGEYDGYLTLLKNASAGSSFTFPIGFYNPLRLSFPSADVIEGALNYTIGMNSATGIGIAQINPDGTTAFGVSANAGIYTDFNTGEKFKAGTIAASIYNPDPQVWQNARFFGSKKVQTSLNLTPLKHLVPQQPNVDTPIGEGFTVRDRDISQSFHGGLQERTLAILLQDKRGCLLKTHTSDDVVIQKK